MRQETRTVVRAFLARKPRKMKRTETDGNILRLHDNPIAWWVTPGVIGFTMAGWPTVTTRERLNGLLRELGTRHHFSQCDFEQYLNGDHIESGDIFHIDSRTGRLQDHPAVEAERKRARKEAQIVLSGGVA